MAVGCVTFSLIIGGTVNKAVLQESCAQLDTTVLCLGRGSSSAELRGSVRHISWGEARTLPQGCTTIRLFLPSFYIASLPWLAAVWICPLKLREGPGGWTFTITVASLVVEHGLWLWHTGPVALRHVESSWTRDQTHVPCIGRRTPIHYATREVLPVV